MNAVDRAGAGSTVSHRKTGRLLRKYVLSFAAVVLLALVSSAAIQYQFLVRDFTGFSVRVEREQAQAAAEKIDGFIKGIEGRIAWTTQLPWDAATVDEWRLDAARLLQRAPAITEFRRLDSRGVEQLFVSRLAPDRIGGGADFSHDPSFTTAMAAGVYRGPVGFRRGSEPYMTIALRGAGNDVGIAEVNLKFIWDIVSRIRVGEGGRAYVVNDAGRLIAHPNLNLVLRNTDVSGLSQVRAARADGPASAPERAQTVEDLEGRQVLAASARITTPDWLLLTELPADEAFAPLDAALRRTGLIIIGALAIATLAGFLLARAMVGPIEALRIGAMRIGAGDFEQRIAIKTGDEVEALADQFNLMADRLQESHDTLRQRVRERTAELTAANRRLAAAGERLRRVNAFKSEILGIVAHDLRNPLSVIMTRAEILAKSSDSSPWRDQVAEHVAAIMKAGGRLVGMIEALLTDAMAEAHEITIRRAPVDIPALINEVVNTNHPLAERKKQTLTVVSPASLMLDGDHDRLREAIDNLVSNAIKYTPQGGSIDLAVVTGEDRAVITVADDGAGLTESDMARLFGRFQRLSARPTAGETSTGLGLSIVRRIIELHGGTISAQSAGTGQGSTFTISLPLTSRVSVPPGQTPSGQDAAGSVPSPADGTILVIDDNTDVRESLGVLLESAGIRTISAASADEALAAVGRGLRPSLIVSDYNLHGALDGIEGIAALRDALGWKIPAILVTGDSHKPAMDMIAEHELTALPKPWNGDDLIRLVRQLQRSDDEAGATRLQ